MRTANPTGRGLSFSSSSGGGGGAASGMLALEEIVSNGTVGPFALNDAVTGDPISGSVYQVQVGDVPQNSSLWSQTGTNITFASASEAGTLITGSYIATP